MVSFDDPSFRQIQFPQWVVKPEGRLVLADADFQSTIGFKWGTFVDGTGTVTPDTNHYFGGSRSVKMLTDAVNNHSAELKINLPFPQGEGIYSFEQKWATGDPVPNFGGTNFDMGIEPRRNSGTGFYQGRVRYDVANDEWKYESGVDIYSSFSPQIIIEQPTLQTAVALAGDQWGWACLRVNTKLNEYDSFFAASKDQLIFADMRGTALVNRGSTGVYNLLFFTLVRTAGASAETMRTTDWCITKL